MTSNKVRRDRKADKDIHLNRCSISPDCVAKFNELKLNKKIKYIIYKLTDDYKEIVVEETSEDGDWEAFREKLVTAQSKSKTGKVGKGPRYAVYDFNYELASGEGSRSKITFIAWSPDDAGIQPKMVYASSKDALKRALNGIATEFQANDEDDIEYQSVLAKVSKGLA
ncbi:Cofilin [Lachnellula hyalina]|uniref:Cofilin n=1 Tax=Lachnellula hyalina TaxID=1316788 RepID=A0A8H8R360_9HELO|nr:Cofilin [Lachnellula hyalina]TVY27658.1 Cofilin [Lachnellula hyalina]